MRTRFRRRRGRKAQWSFADQVLVQTTQAAGISFAWLFPPGRAQFMMDTMKRDSITFAGCHLWLDFYWKNTGASAALPDVDLAVFKTDIETTGAQPNLSMMNGQWTQPSTPSAITSWEEDDDDGTESFLWQHHIKGLSPPNSFMFLVGVSNVDAQAAGMQSPTMAAGDADHPVYVCRKFAVTQEWQPDVVIRSQRRLQKSEGIVLAMKSSPSGAGQTSNLEVHFRTLTK